MNDHDCVFCQPEKFFEPEPCVGQLQLPWSDHDRMLLVVDHRKGLERRFGEGNVTVVEVN